MIQTYAPFYKVSGISSLYNPKVEKDEISMAHIWAENGPVESSNRITTGWHVSYNDLLMIFFFLQNLSHLICLLNLNKRLDIFNYVHIEDYYSIEHLKSFYFFLIYILFEIIILFLLNLIYDVKKNK